jgi:ABC-type multidrug transport system fused ATPase/permease subunit
MPYLKFTQAQLSSEVNVIANLPLVIANNIIIPAGTLFSEALVTLLLLTAVAIYDIKVFGFLLMVMIPAFFIYKARRQKIKRISKQMRNAYSSLFSATLKMVEGLPDIRAFGKEHFFKAKFEDASRNITGTFARDHSSQASIARYTEVIAAWCICLLITFTLISQSGKIEILLLLGVYTAASFRIIPSVNRILMSIQQMKIHESTVNEFCRIVNQEYNTMVPESITFNEKLLLKNISFAYPGQSGTLKDLNLTIRRGEKISIIGKSGAGKSSILLIILRFLKEQSGQIIADGTPLTERHVAAWRALIGYVPQNPYILDGTVAENIAFGVRAELIDLKKVTQLIGDVDLEKWVSELPEGIHTRIGEKGANISGGQRQRIALARALYHNAQLLLLDEVTNQLDAMTQKEVVNRIFTFNDPNQTIVMITHHPDLLDRFDKVYDLIDGELKVKEQIAQSA